MCSDHLNGFGLRLVRGSPGKYREELDCRHILVLISSCGEGCRLELSLDATQH